MINRDTLIQQIYSDLIRIKQLMISSMKCQSTELTWAQIDLLFRVSQQSNITAGQMADELGISPSAIAQILSQLEKQNFIARTADQSDRRVSLLSITDSGLIKLTRVKEIAQGHIGVLMSSLSDDELLIWSQLQKKIIDGVKTDDRPTTRQPGNY